MTPKSVYLVSLGSINIKLEYCPLILVTYQEEPRASAVFFWAKKRAPATKLELN